MSDQRRPNPVGEPLFDPAAEPHVPTDAVAQTGTNTGLLRQVSTTSTLVIEGDVIPRRLRRPSDMMRLVLVLSVATIVLVGAYFASSTASGLEHDIISASNRIPHLLLVIANSIGLIGVIALPVTSAVDLLVHKRGRQLLEASLTLMVTVGVLSLAAWLMQNYANAQLLTALTGISTPTQTQPLDAVLGGLVAFVTVARLADRTRWAIAATSIISAIVLANIVTGGITVAGLALSALFGWSIGLLARYALGTPTTRPTGLAVAAALDKVGFPLTVLRASHETADGRRYSATTRSGERMEILVLDRDLEGAGLLRAAWRNLRVRDEAGLAGFTMRRRLEHAALQSYAAQAAGAPVPRLEAVCEVGPDAALLAYARIEGMTFAEIGGALTDSDIDGAWRAVRTLHDAHVVHRTLHAENLSRDANGGVWLLDPEQGSIAAGYVAERVDLAELLCTVAMLAGPSRAIASARRVLGSQRIATALPALQPLAMTPVTRAAIRRRKDVLVQLRDQLGALQPDGEVEQIKIERLKPRTVFTIAAGTVAAYLLLTYLSSVNLLDIATTANWWWVAVGLALSAATYLGAAMSVEGFVPEKLNFARTIKAQLAASFATLVSPPTLGAIAVNVRYLQKAGVHPALAAASIGASQVMAFVLHILLIISFAILAGTSKDVDLKPPQWAIFLIVALLAIALALLVVPVTRKWLLHRVRPIFVQVGPRFLTLAQQPLKLLTGIGGILILNLGYCLCLVVSVRAFGGGGEWSAIAVAYLVGATVGQAAPTPGGMGVVEAALVAGLIAVGIDSGIAVPAVLVFRILTFWLPTIPGWFAFNNLQKNNFL